MRTGNRPDVSSPAQAKGPSGPYPELGESKRADPGLRDLSFALEPVVLRDQGLGAAVLALADQIESARGIAVALELRDGDRLGEKAQVALYQTLREALDQAVRRSPRRITVGVEQRPDGSFEATLRDDGVGERRRANAEAIAERARILGGTVSLEASEHGGTVVVVTTRRGIVIVLAEVLGLGPERFWSLATAPGSLSGVEVWADGTASVAFTNRTGHLA